MVESLIRSRLDTLIVSIDGTTQDVYEVYRVGGRLDRVLENIRRIVEKKKELGFKTPFIEWQFIVMRQNEHQIANARRLASEIGVDNIVFKNVDFPHGEDDAQVARRWQPVGDAVYQRERPFEKPYKETGRRCWRLWRSAVVNWDGGYAPCCYPTDAEQDFGNVKQHSVREIWNNRHYTSARDLFKGRESQGVEVGCVNCNVYLESEAGMRRNGNGSSNSVKGAGVITVEREVGNGRS